MMNPMLQAISWHYRDAYVPVRETTPVLIPEMEFDIQNGYSDHVEP